ncbi:ABC transporter substrate-binding protein [Actinoplanes sp. NBRC 103695]|uniref:ABC transporter substrate-binding protein n=1 Tax=Actinoplanes sp. NBRC 103695 TaxID=3032202 RepID=UPI0024A1FF5C|nr:ABC transporter substrate-binding protein [Actinoplanes sp. NBRC 103695]GLZ00988.1 hypothetical protein Acsp02_82400 [Actinoplanes sp. NBRC 103695]
MKRILALAAAACVAATLTGCGGNDGTGDGTTLTLWHNYGTYSNAAATTDLVAAFEKQNPTIHIKIVSQPQDSYFSLLQSAALAHEGPDLAVMWTGLYALKYEKLLVNLKGVVPDALLSAQKSIAYTAPGFDPARGSLVMPTDTQFYIGFYNKKLFARAGIAAVPRTWDELYAACAKLKKLGVTPLVYGNGGATGATFVPWYDASYLISALFPPDRLSGLYDGSIPWTDPRIQAQLGKWQQLSKRGYTNGDVATSNTNFRAFQNGEAAMIVDGSFDAARFSKSLGPDLAAFVPPFSDTPVKSVVEFAGGGFSITKTSRHRSEAAKFLEFLGTEQATGILEGNGLIPNLTGYQPRDPIARQLIGFAATGGYVRYPMLDNVIQPEVADVGSRQLPSVLAGNRTPSAAVTAMDQSLRALPADRRAVLR